MPTVISVENLSKKYLIDHQKQARHGSLRDVLTEGTKHLSRKLLLPFTATGNDPGHEEFWALRDVSFDIRQGDRVGIIGRNGAGKSTLLKILSRITEPTAGRASIKGRVASLLEVGTGFHPELSGRENIFLNGAILGMSKAEIKQRFDEIVAFAEVEKFLDTPVKRYSSGMYVRLAFAVAAHLEPEILIVDEVLAVGDAQFQKKCMGKMREVGSQGRTVLFVSHNMAAVQALCSKALLLAKGSVMGLGSVDDQVQAYLRTCQQELNTGVLPANTNCGVQIKHLEFIPKLIPSGSPAAFRLELFSQNAVRIDAITILIYSEQRILVSVIDLRQHEGYKLNGINPIVITGKIKSLPLVEGGYVADLYLNTEGLQETISDVMRFEILSKIKGGQIAQYPARVRGLLELDIKFVLGE